MRFIAMIIVMIIVMIIYAEALSRMADEWKN